MISGGGTGGHLYPALAVGKLLRESIAGARVVFIGRGQGLEAQVVPREGFEFRAVSARGLSASPPAALAALGALGLGWVQAMAHLAQLRPRVVVGAGGYVSLPAVVAAWLQGIPVLLMEQNLLPGKASRLEARFARKICVSFEESRRWLPASRVVVTGNPVRPEILECSAEEGRRRLGLSGGSFTLLVTGGSQGAASLNQAVLDSLAAWKHRPWQVVHLTGARHWEAVAGRGQSLVEGGNLGYHPIPYLEGMEAAYAAADLVVCRGGATTLGEITACGLPAVLVPYPHAAEAHQEYNARWLESRGAAVVVADAQVSELLGPLVVSLAEDPGRREAMSRQSRALGRPQALSEILAQVRTLIAPDNV